jgi:type II secretory pathway predicted ATPase ExeA
MLSDVRDYYGLVREIGQAGQAGYFETTQLQQIHKELKLAIKEGKLIALSGIVGTGKTTVLQQIQELLAQDKEILVAKSLSVDGNQTTLGTLIMALFYDLATEKEFRIPTQPERRERALRDLIRKRHKPIVLFIDDAQDLHSRTLLGLKRLIEVVRDGKGTLSVVLAGHPKLKNDLLRATMEEIGARTMLFELEGFGPDKRKYVLWLVAQALAPQARIEDVLTPEAITTLCDRLTTPLQFESYLTRAFDEGFKVGQKPVGADTVEGVLARDLDALESRLVRNGYTVRALTEILNARPREVRAFLRGELPASRTQELHHELLAAGVPL